MEKQVLLVEDEELFAMLLTMEFERHGIKVTRAINGNEALDLIDKTRPDAIVTDLFMSGMDGLQFLRSIKPLCKQIPVVVVTGSNTVEVNDKLAEFSVAHIFRKPFDSADLQLLIDIVTSD